MTDNKIVREKTFSEEIPYFKERIKEIFDNYDIPIGYADTVYLSALSDSNRIVRKAEEEINRQKAEIERLQKEANLVSIQFQDLQERTDEIKAEAYKEFAERLKEKSFKTIRNYGLTKDVVEVCDIDNLVKEMVGEKE